MTQRARILCHTYYFVFGMVGAGLVPALEKNFEDTFGFSHSRMGLLIGVSMFCFSTCSVIAGTIYDRIGARLLMVCSMVLTAISALVIAGCSTAATFSVAFVFFYLALGIGMVINPLVGRLYAERPSRGINILHGFQGVGRIMTPLLVSLALAIGWRWNAVYGVSAFLHLLFIIPLWQWLKFLDEQPAAHASEGNGVKASHVLKNVPLTIALAGFLFAAGYEANYLIWLRNYLQTETGFSEQNALFALTLTMVGYTTIRMLVGMISWGSHPRVLLTLGALNLACLWGLFHIRGVYPMLAMNFIFGFTIGAFWPSLAGAIYEYARGGHGILTGMITIASQLGVVLFVGLAGWVADRAGLRTALLIPPACGAVYLAIYTWFYSVRKTHEPRMNHG